MTFPAGRKALRVLGYAEDKGSGDPVRSIVCGQVESLIVLSAHDEVRMDNHERPSVHEVNLEWDEGLRTDQIKDFLYLHRSIV